jgi:hypothetical protein
MQLTTKQKETAKHLLYLCTLPLIILISMWLETNF